MLFIYWLEDNPQYAKRVDDIHSRMKHRNDQLLTSSFTFGEVLAGVYRKGAQALVEKSNRLLQGAIAEVIPFTIETADQFAHIRGALGFSSPDAIHLACAAQAGADLFLTNDDKLVGKFVPGIQFIASLNTQLF